VEEPPQLTSGSVVSAATFEPHVPLAPGSLISVFGERLSEGVAQAEELPLEVAMAGTMVVMAGRPMPLLFTSEGQVNAIVPYGLNVNTRHQVLVRRGNTYAQPVAVDVAAAQPAVFLAPQPGAEKQGHIYRATADGAQVLAGPSDPAKAGDVIVLYCSGLGAVDPAVEAGEAAPSEEPLARTVDPVELRIGGKAATVFYSGLVPGFSGLYQVNAVVPEGGSTGDSVPVTLKVAGQMSPDVSMAAR
jgi:adhesin/invasin